MSREEHEEVASEFNITTPIRYPHTDGHATGFFYCSKGESYLITNRHAIYQSVQDSGNLKFRTDSIVIRVRGESSPGETGTHRVSLYEDGSPIWKEHPDHRIDVVAIPLDIDINRAENEAVPVSGVISQPVVAKGFPSPNFGDSAVILGYPTLSSEGYYPILRNGLLATPFGKHYDGKPLFLIDANLQDGMSGSPVVWISNTGDSPTTEIIGIHSGPLDVIHDGTENLHRVWYFKTVKQILGEFRETKSAADW